MKKLRQVVALILSVMMIFSLSLTSISAAEFTPYAWSQLAGTHNDFVVDENTGRADMVARTVGNSNSTKVTLEMTLERLEKGKWVEYDGNSWSKSSTTTFSIGLSKAVYVEPGNYRLRTEHSATGPNGTDTDTIISNIYIFNN